MISVDIGLEFRPKTVYDVDGTSVLSQLYYHLSKTLAEQAALKFAEEHGIDLVTLHPGFVLGPLLQPVLNITSEGMLNFIKKGQEIFPDGTFRFVDVRDVAYGHIQAFEISSASGRYCLVGRVAYSSEAFEILHKLYPAISVPETCKKEKPAGPPYHVSKERAKRLGIDFLPLETKVEEFKAVETEESMSGRGKLACVTGASGYIAAWLVKMLLERHYTVNATVRSLKDPQKTEHLLALDGAKERLHLFEANLLEEGSFDPAVDGCDCVFHTASPVNLSSSIPQVFFFYSLHFRVLVTYKRTFDLRVLISFTQFQAELVEPAVKGTLNVLQSCTKFPSIKRVVITSSTASIMITGKPLKPDTVMDETWFSSPVLSLLSPFKTLAEQAALKFAEEHGIDLVTLHPGFVLGPLLQPVLNATSEGMLNLIKTGKEMSIDGIYRFVDVRDVAYAHIQAFEIPSACGRYCLVGSVAYSSEALKIIHKLYPAISLPDTCKKEKPAGPPFHVSKERAKSLGIDFLPLEVSLKDMVESLMEKNFLIL
uniref:NAD-dependent epimerase/dehydratase domain-containing protein n=1 Tax=Daucus carota subsp. sativus TaxID=79200 RepID=A0A166IGF3_DAUCS